MVGESGGNHHRTSHRLRCTAIRAPAHVLLQRILLGRPRRNRHFLTAGTSATPASGSGVSPSHTFAIGGTYSVTLTVTDDDSASGSASQNVTVSAPTEHLALSGSSTSTSGNRWTANVTIGVTRERNSGFRGARIWHMEQRGDRDVLLHHHQPQRSVHGFEGRYADQDGLGAIHGEFSRPQLDLHGHELDYRVEAIETLTGTAYEAKLWR